ncbi:hypothetical protein QE369_000659 [Agrobacterium larrymoorei]|uniref:Uncharacterized protein n=1 Tax=Agrobacterium larrymoorei TaxID=160699 RepID=A0AAJ2EPX1_9HYPH|nr:hypothetical protein [Agrobacterium larrymoorei]MDR6100481.1 hypothetical protein [Agrobacterium larrymoorei]
MADSDNSRTLPSSIQRNLFAVASNFLVAELEKNALDDAAVIDPALRVWHDWMSAFDEYARLTDVQQRLEKLLLQTIGLPQVRVPAAGEVAPVLARSEAEIDALLPGEDRGGQRDALKRDLVVRAAAWKQADEAEGFSRAKALAHIAGDRQAELLESLWLTPALSTAGMAAKVHAVLRHGEPGPDYGFPWTPLRGVLADFLIQNGVSIDDLSAAEAGRTGGRSR